MEWGWVPEEMDDKIMFKTQPWGRGGGTKGKGMGGDESALDQNGGAKRGQNFFFFFFIFYLFVCLQQVRTVVLFELFLGILIYGFFAPETLFDRKSRHSYYSYCYFKNKNRFKTEISLFQIF